MCNMHTTAKSIKHKKFQNIAIYRNRLLLTLRINSKQSIQNGLLQLQTEKREEKKTIKKKVWLRENLFRRRCRRRLNTFCFNSISIHSMHTCKLAIIDTQHLHIQSTNTRRILKRNDKEIIFFCYRNWFFPPRDNFYWQHDAQLFACFFLSYHFQHSIVMTIILKWIYYVYRYFYISFFKKIKFRVRKCYLMCE